MTALPGDYIWFALWVMTTYGAFVFGAAVMRKHLTGHWLSRRQEET